MNKIQEKQENYKKFSNEYTIEKINSDNESPFVDLELSSDFVQESESDMQEQEEEISVMEFDIKQE